MPTSHVEARVTATLSFSEPLILRLDLNDLYNHAAVSALISPSTGVRIEAANSATKSAPDPQNQKIQCLAPCLPADGNHWPPAPGLFAQSCEVPVDFLS